MGNSFNYPWTTSMKFLENWEKEEQALFPVVDYLKMKQPLQWLMFSVAQGQEYIKCHWCCIYI